MELMERAENWNKSIGVLPHEDIIIAAIALIADLVAALPKAKK